MSISAARVVDFPEPVGPVTSTRPRGFSAILAIAAHTFCATISHADDAAPTPNLPATGKLENGKPVGEGWVRILVGSDLAGWKHEPEYWSLKDGVLHGESKGGAKHHYMYSEKEYADFELHAMVRMSGKDANSGVCIRIKPTDFDNVPGYQVDMGDGYWGCLWDERRDGMVGKCEGALAKKLVKSEDWNHYYVIAKGHHIQIWLNGVKTVDVTHEKGFPSGALGIQLCHGDKHTGR